MRPLDLLCLSLSLCACSRTDSLSLPRIYGGHSVRPDHTAARSTVALTLSDGQRICSGTYLGRGTVLTAAHCIVPFGDRPVFVEFRGLPGAAPLKIFESRTHAGYVTTEWSTRPEAPYHDVALSFFEGQVPTEATPAALSLDQEMDSSPLLAGYGETGDWDFRGESLRVASVTKQQEFSAAAIVCLTGGARRDCSSPLPLTRVGACSGDSGGSIFNADGRLAGIISYIDESCEQGLTFGVLIRPYADWIFANAGFDLGNGPAHERREVEAMRIFHTGAQRASDVDFAALAPFGPVAGWHGFLCADYRDGRDASVWIEETTGREFATEFTGRCASWTK